jgi:hypothetical protein
LSDQILGFEDMDSMAKDDIIQEKPEETDPNEE